MPKIEKMDVDEAVKRKGDYGTDNETTLKLIEKSQDDRFKDIYSLRFGWKKQPPEDSTKEPESKLMSMLPNGKVIFIDRSQDEKDVIPEDPYICLVYEMPRVAFAKVLFPEYQPKIYIPPSRLPVMVWKDANNKTQRKIPDGNSYEERLTNAIREMELLGFDSFKIIFRKNVGRGVEIDVQNL